jgi:hypothetical protein
MNCSSAPTTADPPQTLARPDRRRACRRRSPQPRPLPLAGAGGDAVARGSGPADRAAARVQTPPGGGGEGALRAGQGYPNGGMERTAGAVPRHRLWRHPRPVLRPHRALPHRRRHARHQLSLHGRLRGYARDPPFPLEAPLLVAVRVRADAWF